MLRGPLPLDHFGKEADGALGAGEGAEVLAVGHGLGGCKGVKWGGFEVEGGGEFHGCG